MTKNQKAIALEFAAWVKDFSGWVDSLPAEERVLVPATPAQVKRNETFAEFFANRSSN